MVKMVAKFKAIEMRKDGHSYAHIAKQVGVSKSTVSIWVQRVPYIPNQETLDRISRAVMAMKAAQSAKKQKSFKKAKEEATLDIGNLTRRDIFMLGLGLYIGEGTKSTQETTFVNANVTVMRFVVRWLHDALGVGKKHIRIRLHLYPDSDIRVCEDFWASQLRIPLEQFSPPVIDRRENKRKSNAGKLPYGTAHLTVRSLGEERFGVFLARKIRAWSERVLE